jgi:hypothetical protein
MTAPTDLDRQLEAYLTDGPIELPEPSFDAVRDRMESTRQRVVLGPWRFADMSKLVPIAIGGAAAVVAVALGVQFLRPVAPGGVGGGPSPSPSPTATLAPPLEGEVPVGKLLWMEGTPPITVTIPAEGWTNPEGFDALMKGDSEDPPEAALIGGPLPDGVYVYGDPCLWDFTTPSEPATTVDDIVAALAAQPGRDASVPQDVTIGGFPGKHIVLHVPESDLPRGEVFRDCNKRNGSPEYASWGTATDGGEPMPDRWHQGPGQIDELWFVDVGGEVVVLDAMYRPTTPAALMVELRSIVESAEFGH